MGGTPQEEPSMEQQGDEVHVTAQEASGGSKPGVARYILAISLALVIIAFALIWILGVARSPQGDHGAAVSNQAPPTGGAQ